MSQLRAPLVLASMLALAGILATSSWLLPEDTGSTALAGPTGIQGAGNSQLWIQNLDSSQPATVVADLYNQRGGSPISLVRSPVAPGAATKLILNDENTLQNGAYAAILSSDRDIGTISRTEWPTSGGAIMYGSHEPATDLLLPGVVKGHMAETSLISIQNTDTSQQAQATFELLGTDGSPVQESLFSIGPGTSATLDLGKNAEFAAVPDGFDGWARITANVPIVVSHIVDIENSDKGTYALSGWVTDEAADRLYAPMIHAEVPLDPGDSSSTPLDSQIVALAPGSDPVELSLRFLGVAGSCGGQQFSAGPISIGAGQMVRLSQSPATGPLPAGCSASAILESAGGPIVATIVDRSVGTGSLAQAYDAMPADRGAQTVHLPHFLNRAGTMIRQTTAIQVMNLGSEEASVTIAPIDAAGSDLSCGAACAATLPAEGGVLWWPPDLPGLPPGTYGQAVIRGDQPLAVVVTEIAEAAAMDLTSYTGIPAQGGGMPRARDHMAMLLRIGGSSAPTSTLPPTPTGGVVTATPAVPGTPTLAPTNTATPLPGPTDTPIPAPTSTPGLPSTATPNLPPTATATAAGGAGVSDAARERVPPAVLAAALADPSKVAGYGLPANPNLPPGPNNPPRNCLSLVDPGKPYHPLFNSLIFKAGCP